MAGQCISGHDKKVLARVDLEDCQKACVDEKSFQCMSIDYNTNNRYCYMQEVDRSKVALRVCSGFKYIERDCDGGYTRVYML